jgi:nitrogen fixation protein NifQ
MLYARSDGRLTASHSYETVSKWLLLKHADAPDDILVRAYATVIGSCCDPHGCVFVPALGLEMPYFRGLLATCFPRFIAPHGWLGEQNSLPGSTGQLAEFPDLLQLLLDYRAVDDDHHRCVSHLVAAACMGSNHLWQDLGLPNRGALSVLLSSHFPALAAKNTGDMKWKKFFYRQLCEREGLNACSSPSCAACCDYDKCFGTEE